jgi:integrase
VSGPPRLRFVRLIKGVYPYFRSKETGDVPLPRPVGSPEFHRRYAELLAEREARRGLAGGPAQPNESTFAFLISRYLASTEYAALADSTRIDYSRTCALIEAELGAEPFRYTTRAMLKAVRDDLAATPRKAHKVKQMASRLYSWAEENDLVPAGFNPAAGLKRLARKGGVREIVVWSDQEIAWVLAAAPPHVVTPLLLALYTGQRREDVAAMKWNQWQGDIVRVRQSKTGALLDIACHPVLRAHLEQLRASRKVIAFAGEIALTAKGKPFTANGLSGAVRRVVEKIPQMPPDRSMHGLRYAAGSQMAEGGASVAEIEAVLGHRTFKMALKYAGQRLRAAGGIAAMTAGERAGNGS